MEGQDEHDLASAEQALAGGKGTAERNAEVSDGGGPHMPESAKGHRPPPFAPPKS